MFTKQELAIVEHKGEPVNLVCVRVLNGAFRLGVILNE